MFLSAVLLIFLEQPAAPHTDARVRLLAHGRIRLAAAIASEPRMLAAVKAKNQAGEDEAAIQKRDREWRADKGYPLRAELTSNDCAVRLRELIKGDSFVAEAFLIDARGALVCASRETSDYWQGDEDKWLKTFKDEHDFLVEDPAWDASAATYAIQLSQLVKDDARKVGVITLTIRIPASALNEKP
jgi:hypothetical protein